MFSCSGRCPEPLESAREAPEIEYGGLNNLLSFPVRTSPLLLGKILGFVQAATKSISGASRADSSGSGHLSESRKIRCATQKALTREPVFTRHFDLFTEQPPGVCGRPTKSVSFRVFSAEYAAFMDCTDRIYQFTHSTDQSRTKGARDSLARGRQGA